MPRDLHYRALKMFDATYKFFLDNPDAVECGVVKKNLVRNESVNQSILIEVEKIIDEKWQLTKDHLHECIKRGSDSYNEEYDRTMSILNSIKQTVDSEWHMLNSDEVDEAYAPASLMTVRNQLMNKLGDEFEATGGSTVPKVKITSLKDPSMSFDIVIKGQNVEVTPNKNNIPDYLHVLRNISYNRAANVIYDFIIKTLSKKNEGVCRRLRIKE